MNLKKLTTEELVEVLSAQTKILTENRDTLKPEQHHAISALIDLLASEIDSRKHNDSLDSSLF